METAHNSNVRLLNAWRIDVLLQNSHGSLAEYSPARNVRYDLYYRIQNKSADTDLYIRVFERSVRRIQSLVGALSLHMDDPLGIYYAVA